ncbi:MAG: hypothetical protein AB8H80_03200 [Planctomycetota bacterium]
MKKWSVTAALITALVVVLWRSLTAPPAAEMFSIHVADGDIVKLDDSWADRVIQDVRASPLPPQPTGQISKTGSGVTISTASAHTQWWKSLSRTGKQTYESFVFDPSNAEATQLLRNTVLNPNDTEIERSDADALCKYFASQSERVEKLHPLVEDGRMRLVKQLLSSGALPPVSVDDIRGKQFLVSGHSFPGEALLKEAGRAPGKEANDESLAMTALSMAGIWKAGDTITFAEGNTYLLISRASKREYPTR